MTEFPDPRFEPIETTSSVSQRRLRKPRPKVDFPIERRLWVVWQLFVGVVLIALAVFGAKDLVQTFGVPRLLADIIFVVLFLSTGLFFTHAVLIALGRLPLAFARALVVWTGLFVVLALATWAFAYWSLLNKASFKIEEAGTFIVFLTSMLRLIPLILICWGLWKSQRALAQDIENWIEANLPARIYDDTIPPRPREVADEDDEPLA